MAIKDFIDSVQCGLASIVLGADDPILLHSGSVGRKDRAPKLLEDGLQAITHFSGSCRLAGDGTLPFPPGLRFLAPTAVSVASMTLFGPSGTTSGACNAIVSA